MTQDEVRALEDRIARQQWRARIETFGMYPMDMLAMYRPPAMAGAD